MVERAVPSAAPIPPDEAPIPPVGDRGVLMRDVGRRIVGGGMGVGAGDDGAPVCGVTLGMPGRTPSSAIFSISSLKTFTMSIITETCQNPGLHR